MGQDLHVSINSVVVLLFVYYMYLLSACTLPSTADTAHNRSAATGHSSHL